jgi:hypothetical protein
MKSRNFEKVEKVGFNILNVCNDLRCAEKIKMTRLFRVVFSDFLHFDPRLVLLRNIC